MSRSIKNQLPILFLFLLVACTEVWDGKVNPAENILVVRALLTDQPEVQTVELYTTTGYGQNPQQIRERNAVVYVEDNTGQKWYFVEDASGAYQSMDIQAQHDKEYTLYIELDDGRLYASSPQALENVKPLNTIVAEPATLMIDVHNHNLELVPEWVQGVELYTDIDMGAAFSKRIRFENEIMFQYNVVLNNKEICLQYLPGNNALCDDIDPDDPPRMNCRTRLPLNDVVNITMPGMDLPVDEVYRHNLGFAPTERRFYNLSFPGTLQRRVLITSQFSLTSEAFGFYRQMREQLLAEDAIFDPVPTQITGNMRCLSDPERPVIGLFEVAGKTTHTFVTSHEPWQPNNLWLQEIDDLSFLPDHECFLESIPPYWIFN